MDVTVYVITMSLLQILEYTLMKKHLRDHKKLYMQVGARSFDQSNVMSNIIDNEQQFTRRKMSSERRHLLLQQINDDIEFQKQRALNYKAFDDYIVKVDDIGGGKKEEGVSDYYLPS